MRKELAEFCHMIAGAEAAERLFGRLFDVSCFSYATIHPYGFYIWKLPEISPKYSLRVHVWLPEIRRRQQPDWPPHSHNSNLYSFIISGQITNFTWSWEADDAGVNQIYEVGYEGGLSKLTKTAMIGNLTTEQKHTYLSPSSYLVPAGVYHASEVDRHASAVTVVLLDNKTDGPSRVIGLVDGDPGYVFDRKHTLEDDQKMAREIVRQAIRYIK